MKVLPPPSTCAKLFATGATVGPVVDSFHNQCLLHYDLAPISLAWPAFLAADQTYDYFFCSSWTVPPLLGVAYVVLGGILPRLFQSMIQAVRGGTISERAETNLAAAGAKLRTKAVAAVFTTALIVKLSEFLETHPSALDGIPIDQVADSNLIVMLAAAISQWALLDGTLAALLAASITSLGGPLSELPFVAYGFWHYLPQAGDYLPLASIELGDAARWLLGDNYQDLTLSSITGPCYFAVTMDAIALGRWFDSSSDDDTCI